MTMRIGLHYGPAVNHLKDELRAKARDFDYTDISTNGRYVQTQDGEPIYLRRKTLPL